MVRQANYKKHLLVMVIVITLLFGSGGIFLFIHKGEFEKCQPFPTESYLRGDAVWSNVDYVISGTFQNTLVQAEDSPGNLCSVVTETNKTPLPVIFQPSANKQAPEREQKIKVKVQVKEDGAIVASDYMLQ